MGEAKRRRDSGQRSPLARKKKNQRWVAGIASAFGLIAVAALVYWLSNPELIKPAGLPTAEGNNPFPAGEDRHGISVGDADAPIVIREFADYECPACRRFANAVAKLKNQYIDTGKVRYVFFDLPLRQHDNAVPAAEAARCAEDQNAWWAMHKKLFEEQSSWNTASDPEKVFTGYAESLGLDRRRLARCLSGNIHRDDVMASKDLARDLQITGTPMVMVDNIVLTRTNWAQLSSVIDRELNKIREKEAQ